MGIWAIVRRELNAYFFSPLAYIVATAFLLINGYVFWLLVNVLNDPRQPHGAAMEYFFSGDNTYFWLLMLFVVPAITMRLLAEERKSGTLEVLLTSPITETQVVLGKFFGALSFFVFLWLPTLFYVWIVSSYSDVDAGPIAAGYLGVFLLGSFFLALGTFASALTKNQMVAAIIGFAMLIFVFSLAIVQYVISDPAWKRVFDYVSLFSHMNDFSKGIVDSRALVYYFSGTALFLWLAARVLEAKKAQ